MICDMHRPTYRFPESTRVRREVRSAGEAARHMNEVASDGWLVGVVIVLVLGQRRNGLGLGGRGLGIGDWGLTIGERCRSRTACDMHRSTYRCEEGARMRNQVRDWRAARTFPRGCPVTKRKKIGIASHRWKRETRNSKIEVHLPLPFNQKSEVCNQKSAIPAPFGHGWRTD